MCSINRNVVGSETVYGPDVSNIGEVIEPKLKEIANPTKKLVRYNPNENKNNNLLSKMGLLILLITFRNIFSIITIKRSCRFLMAADHTETV